VEQRHAAVVDVAAVMAVLGGGRVGDPGEAALAALDRLGRTGRPRREQQQEQRLLVDTRRGRGCAAAPVDAIAVPGVVDE